MADPVSHPASDRGESALADGLHVERIDEVEFQPGTRQRRRLTGLQWTLIGAGVLLALLLIAVLYFVFAARSVYVNVMPADAQIRFESEQPQFQAGDRILTLSGEARVRIDRDGYVPVDETVAIDGRKIQTLEYNLILKPGYVTVVFDRDVSEPSIRIGEVAVTQSGTEIEAGEHPISVVAPRFQPYDGKVTVSGGGRPETIEIALVPDWADVSFSSEPPGADIVVDGEVRGQTPAVIEVLAGAHEVNVVADGYKAWRRPLRTVANQPQAFEEIVLEKADGLLSVATVPAGAAISVDGRYRGRAPLDLRLPPGESYRISASRSGFETVSRRVRVRGDRDVALTLELSARFGDVTFDVSPAGATVWVKGEQQALIDGRLSLPAVEQTIEIRADGHVSETRTLTPNPAYAQNVEVTLRTIAEAREAAIPKQITSPDGQSLVLLKPYPFQMGASRRERGRRANEIMRNIDNLAPFYVATTEVTNAHFKAFRADHESGYVYKVSLDPAEHPVVNLTVRDAMAYCNWLSEKEGLKPAYQITESRITRTGEPGYRLPTEAEWAFAARYAGRSKLRRFPWGDAMPPAEGSGNYADRSAIGLTARTLKAYSDDFPATSPVGTFPPNPAGLYDIGGNVGEWTETPYSAGSTDGGEGDYFVARGSSWMHADLSELRLTFRDFSDIGRPDVGFRIVRDIVEPEL